MPFIDTFIEQLRTVYSDNAPWALDAAQTLAEHLQERLNKPYNDGFDLQVTGDEQTDRAALAAWLETAANAPPFLVPTWGRTFSGAVAWVVANNHEITYENIFVGGLARRDAALANVVREKGMKAAYERVVARVSKHSVGR